MTKPATPDGRFVEYVYDAKGNRLSQAVTFNALERGKGKKKGLYRLPNGKKIEGKGVYDLIVETLNDP